MTRPERATVAAAVVTLAAAALALVPLLLLDGPHRTNGYRLCALVLALLATRGIIRFIETSDAEPADSPFRRRRRRPRLPPVMSGVVSAAMRRRATVDRTEHDSVLIAAEERAGHFHLRLRPLLQAVADERLRARHGLTLDGDRDRVRHVLGNDAYELLRSDRPAPDDRRAPGLPRADLDVLVAAVEAL